MQATDFAAWGGVVILAKMVVDPCCRIWWFAISIQVRDADDVSVDPFVDLVEIADQSDFLELWVPEDEASEEMVPGFFIGRY